MNKHERRQVLSIIELLNKGVVSDAIVWLNRLVGKTIAPIAPNAPGIAPEQPKAKPHDYDFVCWCDGSCWPNPGGLAKLGVLIENREGVRVYQQTKEVLRGPKATNNAAEAASFGHALEVLRDLAQPGQTVLVQGDSQLTVNHLTGKWRIKYGHYRRWALDAQEQLKKLRARGVRVIFRWIPRELNRDADEISR